MKKPKDILKNKKFLHLPEGSVLIPYLQSNRDDDLKKIFEDTNREKKAPIYFCHS